MAVGSLNLAVQSAGLRGAWIASLPWPGRQCSHVLGLWCTEDRRPSTHFSAQPTANTWSSAIFLFLFFFTSVKAKWGSHFFVRQKKKTPENVDFSGDDFQHVAKSRRWELYWKDFRSWLLSSQRKLFPKGSHLRDFISFHLFAEICLKKKETKKLIWKFKQK